MPSPVLAVLWFDTEDFVNPETDDAPLRIAQLMEKYGVRVVFKIVGEKLRALKSHGRKDVLEAMSHHEIGYHSNMHSVHPVMSEYVGNSIWEEGEKAFELNERSGCEEIKQTFGRDLSCFGHPGSSWIPQAYPVLKKWKIPVYLDEMSTVTPLNKRPFWYGNMLNIMCLGSNILTLDAGVGAREIPEDSIVRFRSEFKKLYEKLQSEDQIGVISVYCHPTTYITSRWWEKGNYQKGKNPPGMKPSRAPLKTRERVELDLKNLEEFLVMARTLPNLHFVTAYDALSIYEDKALSHQFSIDELMTLSEKSLDAINYLKVDREIWVSPAELYGMVLSSLVEFKDKGTLPKLISCKIHPFGPRSEPESSYSEEELDLINLLEACKTELRSMQDSGYISNDINLGKAKVSPVDFFASCCWAFVEISKGRAPVKLKMKKGNFEVGKMVTMEGAKIDWSYPLLADGFEAPMQTTLARLQTWTMKPATADESKIR